MSSGLCSEITDSLCMIPHRNPKQLVSQGRGTCYGCVNSPDNSPYLQIIVTYNLIAMTETATALEKSTLWLF